jgi:hypothetical protein
MDWSCREEVPDFWRLLDVPLPVGLPQRLVGHELLGGEWTVVFGSLTL